MVMLYAGGSAPWMKPLRFHTGAGKITDGVKGWPSNSWLVLKEDSLLLSRAKGQEETETVLKGDNECLQDILSWAGPYQDNNSFPKAKYPETAPVICVFWLKECTLSDAEILGAFESRAFKGESNDARVFAVMLTRAEFEQISATWAAMTGSGAGKKKDPLAKLRNLECSVPIRRWRVRYEKGSLHRLPVKISTEAIHVKDGALTYKGCQLSFLDGSVLSGDRADAERLALETFVQLVLEKEAGHQLMMLELPGMFDFSGGYGRIQLPVYHRVYRGGNADVDESHNVGSIVGGAVKRPFKTEGGMAYVLVMLPIGTKGRFQIWHCAKARAVLGDEKPVYLPVTVSTDGVHKTGDSLDMKRLTARH